MQTIFSIQLQKLFLITLVLKILASYIGWKVNSPWGWGFGVPLAIMAIYVWIGWNRQNSEVPDDKFADSCYYLGFIFTITSIIFCLIDLPNIGTKLEEMAVRFGAAMVSTVFGLGVRVYLVTFKQDVSDAIEDAESAVIEASHKFREQLVVGFEKMRDFQNKVDRAATLSVERVNLQIENLSKNHAEKLTQFFDELTDKNEAALVEALGEIKTASVQLSETVEQYSLGISTNLKSIETKVDAFASAVTNRLSNTTFPDDYFARSLAGPLAQLNHSVSAISMGVMKSAGEVDEAGKTLSGALKTIRTRATSAENAMDKILVLAQQQQSILESTEGQSLVFTKLTESLGHLEETLTQMISSINAETSSNGVMTAKIEGLTLDKEDVKQSLVETRTVIAAKIEEVTNAVKSLTSILNELDPARELSEALDPLNEKLAGLHKINEQAADSLQLISEAIALAPSGNTHSISVAPSSHEQLNPAPVEPVSNSY